MLCRAANSRYEVGRAAARRAGDWNGIVPAARARRHLLDLSRQGVGRRAVAAASGVAQTVIQEIRAGRRPQIRARTERQLLAVDRQAFSGGVKVPAAATWRRITQLLEEGYTKGRLARELGMTQPALQLGRRRVLAATAARVERLHARLLA